MANRLIILLAIHLAICTLTGFDKKYKVIFTLVLLVSIGAVLMEHIKAPHNRNSSAECLYSFHFLKL
jgi:hypothetical protein